MQGCGEQRVPLGLGDASRLACSLPSACGEGLLLCGHDEVKVDLVGTKTEMTNSLV